MRRFTIAGVLFAAALLVAPTELSAQQNKQKGDRYRITQEDLVGAPASVGNAYDIVQTLRPLWLSPPRGRMNSANLEGGGGGATEVVVYINDNRQPSLEELRTVRASMVFSMRYLEQNRAVQMRGPGHEAGVIEVITTDKNR